MCFITLFFFLLSPPFPFLFSWSPPSNSSLFFNLDKFPPSPEYISLKKCWATQWWIMTMRQNNVLNIDLQHFRKQALVLGNPLLLYLWFIQITLQLHGQEVEPVTKVVEETRPFAKVVKVTIFYVIWCIKLSCHSCSNLYLFHRDHISGE